MELSGKIRSKTAKVGIIGLGYVGLPLAVAFVEATFCVLGFDIKQKRVDLVNRGQSYIVDVNLNFSFLRDWAGCNELQTDWGSTRSSLFLILLQCYTETVMDCFTSCYLSRTDYQGCIIGVANVRENVGVV